MGCDIHLTIEVFDGTRWNAHQRVSLSPVGIAQLPGAARKRFPGVIVEPEKRPSGDNRFWQKKWDQEKADPLYLGERNYMLFGVLAGIRDDESTPIAKPRGIPHDASPDYLWQVEGWGSDAHSYSWVTLAELLAYPWAPNPAYLHANLKKMVTRTIPALQKLGAPDRVRLVFFFDN